MDAALGAVSAIFGRANGHVLGASGLVAGTFLIAATLTLFGDPRLAEARFIQPLPAREQALVNLTLALRHTDNPPHHAPEHAADHAQAPSLHLRPHVDEDSEPRLAGVGELTDVAHGHGADHGGSQSHAAVASPRGLGPAPLPGLSEPGPGGPLPVTGAHGEKAHDAYARPFTAPDDRPLIAVVVGGLGLSAKETERAIEELPAEVTLAFVPYVDDLQSYLDRARAAGHEVVLEAPMEPYDYPANDPGPYTLLAETDRAENTRRLEWLMARGAGYFAVMNYLGSRFASSERAVDALMKSLAERGVAMLHDGDSKHTAFAEGAERHGAPFAAADRVLDGDLSRSAIDEQLLELEALAIQHGAALGVGAAYRVTIEHVAAWANTLDMKGYALAPASAVVRARAAHASTSEHEHADYDAHESASAPVFKTVQAGYGRHDESAADAKGDHGGGH